MQRSPDYSHVVTKKELSEIESVPNDKAKPPVRVGRKATGLETETAELPKDRSLWYARPFCLLLRELDAVVYWQLDGLKWNGVGMTKEARAILASIRASKLQRVAA